MRLPVDAAVKCLQLLLDGMSIRAVERFMKVNRNTLCDLILNVGQRCKLFLADRLQGLPVADIQVDEVWSFVGCKEKTKVRLDKSEENGDAYAYIDIERHTKLIVSYLLGKRDADDTREFAGELRKATSGRFQLGRNGGRNGAIHQFGRNGAKRAKRGHPSIHTGT